jgi:hypothetical protein
MRNLTDDEVQSLYDEGKCPFCGSQEFYEGPQGGMNTNWYCANEECGAGFNLTEIRGFNCQVIKEPKERV